MKVGIVGYSGAGKSTVFEWLTGTAPDPSKMHSGQLADTEVPDARLDWLFEQYKPKKPIKYARLEFFDTPGLMPDERDMNPRRLGVIRNADGLLIVLNGYSGTDIAAELRNFRDELLFADLEVVMKRIEKLESQLKKPRPGKQRELDEVELALLKRISDAMEQGISPAALDLSEDEEKSIRSFQLLTLKPELVLLNIGDDGIGQPIPAELTEMTSTATQAPAKLEMELNDLGEEDRAEFMEGLGLEGFVREEVLQFIFSGMDRIVFFTVGHDECRAWPIHKGTAAVDAAGEIHTDLSNRFVRAEVISYEEHKRVGTVKEAKAQGVLRLEGKTYVVQDGDIMHIL